MRSTQRERWKIRHENQYRRNTLAPSWGLAGDQGQCSLFSVRFESALLSVWPVVACPLAVAVPASSGCAVCGSQSHLFHLHEDDLPWAWIHLLLWAVPSCPCVTRVSALWCLIVACFIEGTVMASDSCGNPLTSRLIS